MPFRLAASSVVKINDGSADDLGFMIQIEA